MTAPNDRDPVEVLVCGPRSQSAPCPCDCPDGPCGHVWDGPTHTAEDGLMSTATCSRCGMLCIEHDLWRCS